MIENKEIKDEKLEKVSGGYKVSRVSFETGECYQNQRYIYKVINGANDIMVTDSIGCVVYDKSLETTTTDNILVSKLINNCSYIGKNII